jgi:hypothetical protein
VPVQLIAYGGAVSQKLQGVIGSIADRNVRAVQILQHRYCIARARRSHGHNCVAPGELPIRALRESNQHRKRFVAAKFCRIRGVGADANVLLSRVAQQGIPSLIAGQGQVVTGKRYTETDFNKIIEIKEREAHRVKVFMERIDHREKTLVFCATQDHALAVRDLINQMKTGTDPNYCQRVTADDGELGNQHLRDFQDNEKTIPTILTTSQKLSTGVDARNIRNIVLMRPIKTMIEFKQIRTRHTALRWQGLLHHLRLREGVPSFQRSGMGRRAAGTGTVPEVWLSALPMRKEAAATMPHLRKTPMRVPERALPDLQSAPMRMQEKGKSEAC